MEAKIIAITNQKDEVGKSITTSTITIVIAGIFKIKGLVMLDFQTIFYRKSRITYCKIKRIL